MSTPDVITISSPAKLNWLLHVGPVRHDGYHSLHTVYQTLSIADTLTIARGKDNDVCDLSGFPADVSPDSNLVKRAWHLCRSTWPDCVGGISVHVEKVLPRGGGLGGGSSNAGVALRAIASLFRLSEMDEDVESKLQNLAANLGSDVPFFLYGGTAAGTGRGEIIEPLPPVPSLWLVLIMPKESISTAEAYRSLDELTLVELSSAEWKQRTAELSAAARSAEPEALAPLIYNDFEKVAHRYAWFKNATRSLESTGALRAFLCGSGSTVAGLYSSESAARSAAEAIGGVAVSTV